MNLLGSAGIHGTPGGIEIATGDRALLRFACPARIAARIFAIQETGGGAAKDRGRRAPAAVFVTIQPTATGSSAARRAMSSPGPASVIELRKAFSRRLLLTTKTELNAMAAPAIMGLSRPAAARGRAAML